MALVNCDECGREVSDRASACPSCGCPLGQGTEDRALRAAETTAAAAGEWHQLLKVLLWCIIIGMVLYLLSGLT